MSPARDANASKGDTSSPLPARTNRPLRVLVVDDHLLARCRTRQQLAEISNLQVVGEATDGFEAVALARTLSPDLVFMDISMPGLDGLEATRRITAELPQVRVIILSSHLGESFHKGAIAAGAHGYVGKGESTEGLAAAIQQVFSGRRREEGRDA
jgi:DNA-binding NarL/FixJ family response regulator